MQTFIGVVIGALLLWWGIERYAGNGRPPPTNLRCVECPRLTYRWRRSKALAWVFGLAWTGTAAALLDVVVGRH
ncbi:MAG TPA: hypothetical protein VFD49_19915 [Candidatus Dormibacteraeota bacterium]|nr:hypothetical protein [Candidatus Dormibacteraeota bacterium]